MRAAVINEWGSPDVIHIEEVPEPSPRSKDLVVQVEAAAVNPADVSARQGRSAMAVEKATFPLVLGWDAAGTVVSLGEETEGFSVGDRVVGMAMWLGSFAGTYADLAALDFRFCAHAPIAVAPSEASTIPLGGLTAWSALEVADIQAGETLLVAGAAGGVGGYLVQIAKSRGVKVIGLARSEDETAVRAFGADDFTDDASSVYGRLVAIDTTANPDVPLTALAAGSRLVTISGKPSTEPEGVMVSSARVQRNPDALAHLCAMADTGELKLRVHREFELAKAAEAHTLFEAGGVRGRIVLAI